MTRALKKNGGALTNVEVIDWGLDSPEVEASRAREVLTFAMDRLPDDLRGTIYAMLGASSRIQSAVDRLSFYLSEWLPDPEEEIVELRPDAGLLARCLFNAGNALDGHEPPFTTKAARRAFLSGLLRRTPSILSWSVWAPIPQPSGAGKAVKRERLAQLPKPPAFCVPPEGVAIEVWEPLVSPLSRWVAQRHECAPYMSAERYADLSDGEVAAMVAARVFGIRDALNIGLGDMIALVSDEPARTAEAAQNQTV